MVVGQDQRLFAAHEDVLSLSPYFRAVLKEESLEEGSKQLVLPEERVLFSRCGQRVGLIK